MNYESVMKLALERGFYFPSCEVYGDAQAGFWEYGPTGVSVKNKFLELWRRELVRRDTMLEIDGSQIMSKSVFEASGHLGNFADPIIKCKKCGSTYRADKLIGEVANMEIPESADLEDFDLQNEIAKPFIEGKISSVYVEKIIKNVKKNPKTSLDKIIKNVVSGIEVSTSKEKFVSEISVIESNLSIEEKILNFSIELESISEQEIPEYRRLRVISSLKILDSKIKSSLNHMNTSFLEKSKIYNK